MKSCVLYYKYWSTVDWIFDFHNMADWWRLICLITVPFCLSTSWLVMVHSIVLLLIKIMLCDPSSKILTSFNPTPEHPVKFTQRVWYRFQTAWDVRVLWESIAELQRGKAFSSSILGKWSLQEESQQYSIPISSSDKRNVIVSDSERHQKNKENHILFYLLLVMRRILHFDILQWDYGKERKYFQYSTSIRLTP